MKKIFFLLLSIILLCLLAAGCIMASNKKSSPPAEVLSNGYPAPDGFRDLKWNTDLKDIANMQYVKAVGGNMRQYVRDMDQLKIEQIPLKKISYYFIKNKLAEVTIEYDPIYFAEIVEVLEKKYGAPSAKKFYDKDLHTFFVWWKGSTSENIITIWANPTKDDWPFVRAETGQLTFYRPQNK